MRIFEQLESEVRGYVRSFPTVFDKAEGALLYDGHGKRYIDFFAGAGTLINYGHNNPSITDALIEYLQRCGIVHRLDKATVAKRAFSQKLHDTILVLDPGDRGVAGDPGTRLYGWHQPVKSVSGTAQGEQGRCGGPLRDRAPGCDAGGFHDGAARPELSITGESNSCHSGVRRSRIQRTGLRARPARRGACARSGR